MRTRVGVRWVTVFVLAANSLGQAAEPALPTPELLVDLARDYGLKQRGSQTDADVQHVRTLLRAAVRLDPELSEAYVWLYELAQLAGDEDDAIRMLQGLLRANPTHEGAFALWLQAGANARQTVEQRTKWLEQVAQVRRPPTMQALVHAHLAETAIERMDYARARQQVKRALMLDPTCVEAAELARAVVDEDTTPAEWLRATLRVAQLRPLDIGTLWSLGRFLNEHRRYADAERFYDAAVNVHARLDPRGELPSEFLLDLAHNRLARHRLDAAIEHTQAAIEQDPLRAAQAGIFLHYLHNLNEQPFHAETVRQDLQARFAALRDPDKYPVNEVAQAAWFHCRLDPQPDRALMLAKAAVARAPEDPFAQRVLGWAHALNDHLDEAQRVLSPLVANDPFAAYKLAQILQDSGDLMGAYGVIGALDEMPPYGPARDLIRGLGLPLDKLASEGSTTQPTTAPTTQPTQEDALDTSLQAFDARVFAFVDEPEKFVEADITPLNRSPSPGEPWRVRFALTNRSPVPITLGPDRMINPVFVVSVHLDGDQSRSYPHLFTVSLDHDRVLAPGETIDVRRTVDVGPPRRVSRQTPQQLQRVRLDVVLDAERTANGDWQPSPFGRRLKPVVFNRVPLATGPEALRALFNAISAGRGARMYRAIELLGELLGEAQRAQLTHLTYRPSRVPAARLQAGLLDLLSHPEWEARARALTALQLVGLNRTMLAAIERCLDDEHWLVRIMAVRVLARQGPAFKHAAEQIAENDADELVRELAASYVKRWQMSSGDDPDSASSVDDG